MEAALQSSFEGRYQQIDDNPRVPTLYLSGSSGSASVLLQSGQRQFL